jgi:3-hydroxyisobutyrate dehydrogenase-like beta-hydroxyacid dehydrogenase
VVAERQIGVLHPGAMGSAVGALLVKAGHQVSWASAGRGKATAERAEQAGLRDVIDIATVVRECEIIFSICPPHAAQELARQVKGFDGIYVDANAVAPATSVDIARVIENAGGRFVDGGIIGGPPTSAGHTRLYLSGAEAAEIAQLFDGTVLGCDVLSDVVGAASALKMSYAGWNKGRQALLLTMRDYARAAGVEDALVHEWELSMPGLDAKYANTVEVAGEKGWRWAGEMQEVADSLGAADLPTGFHRAAAQVFHQLPRRVD